VGDNVPEQFLALGLVRKKRLFTIASTACSTSAVETMSCAGSVSAPPSTLPPVAIAAITRSLRESL
jgi:hypothetical protein